MPTLERILRKPAFQGWRNVGLGGGGIRGVQLARAPSATGLGLVEPVAGVPQVAKGQTALRRADQAGQVVGAPALARCRHQGDLQTPAPGAEVLEPLPPRK